MAPDALAAARDLADRVLFPDAMRVDRLDALPAAHLDAVAAAGPYGAPAADDVGGLGLDLREVSGVVEELASGCLAVAFVLIQHFRLLATRLAREALFLLVFGSRPGIKTELLRYLGAARPGTRQAAVPSGSA
jgi:alkylation response protein AidB-like acyl-CoA dehydrogenase